ncbi:MAG: amino acid-binding protein [Deltaproteobacteria bacterium]|nr:amino acid-binding protein [Deltaproteobacteria bacterium]
MFEPRTQITVFLRNKPGRFAELCDILYGSGVDVRAMCVNHDADFGVVRMVVDDPEAATRALSLEHILFITTEVLVAVVPNRSGMAAGLGHKLAQAGINIEYTYFSSCEPNTRSLMVFKVADLARALKALSESSSEYN